MEIKCLSIVEFFAFSYQETFGVFAYLLTVDVVDGSVLVVGICGYVFDSGFTTFKAAYYFAVFADADRSQSRSARNKYESVFGQFGTASIYIILNISIYRECDDSEYIAFHQGVAHIGGYTSLSLFIGGSGIISIVTEFIVTLIIGRKSVAYSYAGAYYSTAYGISHRSSLFLGNVAFPYIVAFVVGNFADDIEVAVSIYIEFGYSAFLLTAILKITRFGIVLSLYALCQIAVRCTIDSDFVYSVGIAYQIGLLVGLIPFG